MTTEQPPISGEVINQSVAEDLNQQAVVAAAAEEAIKIADAKALLTPGEDSPYSHYIESPSAKQRDAANFLAGKREENARRAELRGNQKEADVHRRVAASYRSVASR